MGGYYTGRWDYINSVADAVEWDQSFINPNIESITMTYGYMKNYEDRVRRAVNTPDLNSNLPSGREEWNPTFQLGQWKELPTAWKKRWLEADVSKKPVPVENGWPTGRWYILSDRSGPISVRTINW